ncbi:hypothetical protein [Enterobacter kobei]|uniref:hypothetical protein n=1 Tax=Enterobacter kobei TaxID=208224 RepID=UPI000A4F4E04|nr:hypothetical protein [Enterobacter kobei]
MSENLISNGEFDYGSSQWNFTSSGSGVTTENETVTVINNYCRITPTEAIYQQIYLDTGKKYLIKINSRSPFLTGTLSIMTLNTNNTWGERIIINSKRSSTWHEEQFTIEAQASWVAPLILHIRAEQNTEQSFYLDVDKIELSEIV